MFECIASIILIGSTIINCVLAALVIKCYKRAKDTEEALKWFMILRGG